MHGPGETSKTGGHPIAGARRILLWAVLLALIAGLAWQAGEWGRRRAIRALASTAQAALQQRAAALQSELEKHRLIPLVLAQDPEIAGILRDPGDAALIGRVDRKLASLASGIRAGAIYVEGADGVTLASSNWAGPDSFVGRNFAFRPYFRSALASGEGRYFALGTTSHEPGYFVAQRAGEPGAQGVVVVKVTFDEIQALWRRSPEHVLVTGADGVVLLTDRPDWQFRTTRPLDPAERAAMRDNQQYGEGELAALPVAPLEAENGYGLVALEDAGKPAYLAVETPLAEAGWRMRLLVPLEPAVEDDALLYGATAGLAGLLAAGIGLWLQSRRDRERRRVARQLETQQELERRVAARTADLQAANDRLRQAEAELVQAAKLAALGQLAASVAHEVNQPLAAMRSYADNAQVLLDRDRRVEAGANLVSISALTERIGRITGQLKDFARKSSGQLETVPVQRAVESCLALLDHRIRRQRVALSRDMPAAPVLVRAEEGRLEQIVLNLLQNALDALAGRDAPLLRLELRAEPLRATLAILDNGPGIAPDILPDLFAAFTTTKGKGEGLGLGLSIARGIAEDFGGTIRAWNRPEGGAGFEVELRPAEEA